jgi:hypothetical protein
MQAKEIGMIHYDIDPSLHGAEPPLDSLEDGFSPPHPQPAADAKPSREAPAEAPPLQTAAPEELIGPKSEF